MKKIFFIIPFLLLFIGIPVKAETLGDINLRIPDNLKDIHLPYYVIYSYGNEKYLYLTKNKAVIKDYDGRYKLSINGPHVLYKFREDDETWQYSSWSSNEDAAAYSSIITSVIANNYDIYHENGTLVFQKAPIRVSFIETMKTLEMGAMMMTVVYLIPLLVVLLASLIGFRKAWAWLLKVLRTA